VLSGCAHAGIINTILYARQITGATDVYAVMGGFHLAGKEFEPRINQTVEQLKLLNPRLPAPSHCTGWRGSMQWLKRFRMLSSGIVLKPIPILIRLV